MGKKCSATGREACAQGLGGGRISKDRQHDYREGGNLVLETKMVAPHVP